MVFIVFLISVLLCTVGAEWETPYSKLVFDEELYQSVLDEELCEQQLDYMITNDTVLLATFLDAGIRTPRGIFEGNLVDLGNYHQCLSINQAADESIIEGKYCMINVPFDQDITWPDFLPEIQLPNITWPELPIKSPFSNETLAKLKKFQNVRYTGLDRGSSKTQGLKLSLAICLPKSCSSKQFIESFFNVSTIGFAYEEQFCRLPNDKKWVPADYVAIAIFSFLLFLAIISTLYDVYQTRIMEKDPKSLSKLYMSFSVITNTRRLVTYNPVPGTIECIDGIRALAMMWVVIGHTFVNQISFHMANPTAVLNWITSPESIWITVAPITVDTFFMLSGLLLVFTTSGKLTRAKLFKNLHLFYLNRLLRMFPILAAFVLLQASLLNRMFDGPYWALVQVMTENCRVYWWSTLLHIQNLNNPSRMCLAHSWYLAIDVQLYIISPIILFFVLSKKKYVPWVALSSALLATLASASTYNFMKNFQSGPVMPSRPPHEQQEYLMSYYVHTLTRASPFFVGMIYGYILHLHKESRIVISKMSATILWTCALSIIAVVTYVTYPIMQIDWDNQTVDNILNSYMRPAWAMAVGWIVLACVQGYGGPIDWILSWRCWKILSRLSYGIYIVHYPLIFLVNSTDIAPAFFSVTGSLFKFLADFVLATIVAYILTLLVDSPCSTLIKLGLGGRAPRRQPPTKENPIKNSTGIENEAFEESNVIKIRL